MKFELKTKIQFHQLKNKAKGFPLGRVGAGCGVRGEKKLQNELWVDFLMQIFMNQAKPKTQGSD